MTRRLLMERFRPAWKRVRAACREIVPRAGVTIRGNAFALASVLCIAAAPPNTRLLTLPARDGVPSHAVRLRVWGAEGSEPRPLLIYEPGWNGSADENSILLSALADKGFTVIALDLATAQPAAFAATAARLRLPMDLSSFAALDRTTVEADWRVALLADDAIESLRAIPEAGSAPAVGILGYSFGGAVAAQVCRQDARFVACLNMDGWLFGPAAEHPGAQPTLLLSGDAYPTRPSLAFRPAAVLDEQDAARLRARMATTGGIYAQIAGLQHGDFTDAGGGNATVRALVEAFFSETLLHRPSALLASDHPLAGVTLTRFPRPREANP